MGRVTVCTIWTSALHIRPELEFDDAQRKKPQECIIGVFIFRLIMPTFLESGVMKHWTKTKRGNIGETSFLIVDNNNRELIIYVYESHVLGSSISLCTGPHYWVRVIFAALKRSPLKMQLRPKNNTPFSYLTARNQLGFKIELIMSIWF